MSTTKWAEHEVELACKREREVSGTPEREWDYGCACYKSALKAYKSLMEDGHSGMSFSFTRSILERLMYGRPLTPLENNPEDWNLCWEDHRSGRKTYQHKRRSSLFKDVIMSDDDNWIEGIETFHDNDAVYCIDLNDENEICFGNGGVRMIYELKHPIIFPYTPPTKPAIAYIERPGDGDYLKIHKFDHRDGRVDIFPEGEEIYKYCIDGIKLVSNDPEEVKKFLKAREEADNGRTKHDGS